jgi:hypothetical protein
MCSLYFVLFVLSLWQCQSPGSDVFLFSEHSLSHVWMTYAVLGHSAMHMTQSTFLPCCSPHSDVIIDVAYIEIVNDSEDDYWWHP